MVAPMDELFARSNVLSVACIIASVLYLCCGKATRFKEKPPESPVVQ
jgi:hypothetical protein